MRIDNKMINVVLVENWLVRNIWMVCLYLCTYHVLIVTKWGCCHDAAVAVAAAFLLLSLMELHCVSKCEGNGSNLNFRIFSLYNNEWKRTIKVASFIIWNKRFRPTILCCIVFTWDVQNDLLFGSHLIQIQYDRYAIEELILLLTI